MHGFSAGAAKPRRNGRSRCTLSKPLQQQKVCDRLAFPAAAFICARLGKRPRWGQLSTGRLLLCSPSPHTTCLGLIPCPEPLPEIALTSSAAEKRLLCALDPPPAASRSDSTALLSVCAEGNPARATGYPPRVLSGPQVSDASSLPFEC